MNAQGDPVYPEDPGRAGHHQRREGHSARRPRPRSRCGDHRVRAREGRQGHRLRPPHARRRRRLLRVVRQRARSASCRARASSSASRPRAVSKPVVAELNGSPTDNNATLFAQGYNSVLEPAVHERHLRQGPEPVRARLGQPEGADDLRADAAADRQQDRRRARGQRRPRATRSISALRRQQAQARSR